MLNSTLLPHFVTDLAYYDTIPRTLYQELPTKCCKGEKRSRSLAQAAVTLCRYLLRRAALAPYAMLLFDSNQACDLQQLDQAWSADPTFALLPARSQIDPDWMTSALAALPAPYQRHHFALLTSGSTGEPKLIIGERRRSEQLARALHTLQQGEEVAETLLLLPLHYSYAFVNQWLWSRVMGRRLVLTQGLSKPDLLRQQLQQAEQAMLCMVGAQVPLLHTFFEGAVFPGIIRLHFAGGRFPQESLEFLHTLFPHAEVFNNYGCAEAMPRMTLRSAEASPLAYNIGRALPGIELRTDEEGHILFRSPYQARAFYDRSGLHLLADDDWTPSGDLGYPTADGSWELLGRSNEVFKRFGEKISLSQLASTIFAVWQGEATFYRESDPLGEEGYVLVLAPRPIESELRALLRALRHHWSRSHWPLRIEGMERLPRLSNQKVDSRAVAASRDSETIWRQRI